MCTQLLPSFDHLLEVFRIKIEPVRLIEAIAACGMHAGGLSYAVLTEPRSYSGQVVLIDKLHVVWQKLGLEEVDRDNAEGLTVKLAWVRRYRIIFR